MTSCVSRVISKRLQTAKHELAQKATSSTSDLSSSAKVEIGSSDKNRTALIIRRHVGNWIHVSECCGVNIWGHLNACSDDSPSFRNEVDW